MQTEQDKEKEREQDRQRKETYRAMETEQEQNERLIEQQFRDLQAMDEETQEDRNIRLGPLRQRRAKQIQMRAEERVATKTYKILSGDLEIPSLTNSIDSIGDMTIICHHQSFRLLHKFCMTFGLVTQKRQIYSESIVVYSIMLCVFPVC